MPRFAYAAVGSDGLQVHGSRKAATMGEVELALYDQQMHNIRVTEHKSALSLEVTPRRVKRGEIMHLSRQLAAFIRAGLPILDAVHTIGAEADNSSLRRMMIDVETGLRSGDSLSDCFDRHPKIFPDFYRGILRSAELTGSLDTVLAQLSTYLERDIEARRKVKSAMIYPAIVSVMSILTIAILAGFVLPRFKTFFESLDAKLPLPTRMLLACTGFLTTWWWAIVGGILAIIIGISLALKTTGGRLTRDRFALSLPIVGETIQYAMVERFTRILASMVGAGVPLVRALSVSTDALHNLVFQRALANVGDAMMRGEGLARPLAATKLFPSTASQMLRVGEETGSLDTQLAVTAEFYETELDYKIKRLTSLIEPAVIIVMGLLVGFVAVALVSAMYGIFNQVKT
jgi:type IV pilus assembly protein PilC